MIRVVMFDLGLTLIDAHDRPFAHVPQALATIKAFKAADGKPLRTCLVSDFTMAEPPASSISNTNCCTAQSNQRRGAMHAGSREQVRTQARHRKRGTATGLSDSSALTPTRRSALRS